MALWVLDLKDQEVWVLVSHHIAVWVPVNLVEWDLFSKDHLVWVLEVLKDLATWVALDSKVLETWDQVVSRVQVWAQVHKGLEEWEANKDLEG